METSNNYFDSLIVKLQGTVLGSINKKAFEEIQIVIPAENQASKFNTIVCSMDKQIKRTEDESRRLATLRDTLLPKLMSGDLKANEIHQSVIKQ